MSIRLWGFTFENMSCVYMTQTGDGNKVAELWDTRCGNYILTINRKVVPNLFHSINGVDRKLARLGYYQMMLA